MTVTWTLEFTKCAEWRVSMDYWLPEQILNIDLSENDYIADIPYVAVQFRNKIVIPQNE